MPVAAWDTSPIREVNLVIRVNGVIKQGQASWGQELVSSLPETVSGTGSFPQRRGRVEWKPPALTNKLPYEGRPGSEWLPKVGESITIDAIDGLGNEVRVFTGLIDSVTGDAHGGVHSKIVDRIDDFNKIVRVEALTEIGAPWNQYGDIRYTSPSCAWVVDDVLRQCGYYATPPRPSGHILDAPLQGTVYLYAEKPDHSNAQLFDSRSLTETDGVKWPQFWGGGTNTSIALRDAYMLYKPYTGPGSGENYIRLSMMVHPNHRDAAHIQATKNDGANAFLRVDGAKRVIVGTTASGTHSAGKRVFTLPSSQEALVVSAIFRNGTVSVESSDGQTANVNLKTPIGPMAFMDIQAGYQAAISGVQVSDPGETGGHVATQWKPTVINRYGWHAWRQRITPSIRDENAKAVLKEFSENMLAPVFLDEHGVVQVASTDTLHAEFAGIKVDTLSTVADMKWSTRLSDLRDAVEIDWHDVSITLNTKTIKKNVLLYQGNQKTFTGDQVDYHDVIEVPENEEWIGRDMAALDMVAAAWEYSAVTEHPEYDQFNAGEGTATGMMQTDGAIGTETEKWSHPGMLTELLEAHSPWVMSYSGLVIDKMTTKVPEDPKISRRYWGMPMPIIRGNGKVRRLPSTYRLGPVDAKRILHHKLGRWNTQSGMTQFFAKWLYSITSKVHPVVHGVVIRFDPRVNVGSVVQVDSTQLHGVALEGLVVSVDHDPRTDKSRIAMRIISTKTSLNTYRDLELAWNGASYETLQTVWATINGTYGDVETDPLWKGY